MSFAKWMSLSVGAGTAVIAGALLLFDVSPAEPAWPAGVPTRLAGALILGGFAGLVHWIAMGRFDRELNQLTFQIESLSRDEGSEEPLVAGMGLAPLAGAVGHSLAALRSRIGKLTARRRELEIQLRIADGEKRYAESVLNSISEAVMVTDAFNEVAMANEAAAQLLGFDRRQARRRPVDQVVRDAALVNLIKNAREGAAAAPLHRRLEHRTAAGGRQIVLDVNISGIHADPGGAAPAAALDEAVAGIVTVVRDVTREREIADMKSDIVSSVSHELRTPLSSIKALVEMLLDGEAHDERARTEFYNIIQSETNRLSRLIENILNISRIESGVVRAFREPIALPAVIREAVEVMLPQARARHIELSERATSAFFQVFADKDMLHQAALNLIGNAIKYTPPGGRVEVATEVDEPARVVRVSVSDTGVGIPPKDLPRLFEKFYRVDQHRKLAQGTGLGLNLVRQIIETVHGGTVSVVSEPGKGSTFTFALPLADCI